MIISILKWSPPWLPLDAPWFAWLGATLIITTVAYYYFKLRTTCIKEEALRVSIIRDIEDFQKKNVLRPGEGFSGEQLEAFEKIFTPHGRYKEIWNRFRSQIVRLTTRDDVDTFWATETSSETFSEGSITDTLIDRSFYQSIPGIFTGLGLLLTFIAILVALIDVRVEQNQVRGLQGLINGLSGKFISSIAALLAASLYMFLEKPVFHRLSATRNRLVDAIDGVVPRLSATQVLASVHRNMLDQTVAFRLFNADLAPVLQKSFSTSVGPTLERMVSSIDDLNQFLRATEENKQQTMAEQVRGLLESIERSMSETLNRMGATFSDSLSGSARNEFGMMVDSLKSSAKLVNDLNEQFEGTQSAIRDLVELAKQSTSDQMASGRRQVEEIATSLKLMMEQMEKTTGASSSQMLNALTYATDALSNKVGELSDRMTQLVQESTGQVHQTASRVIQEAGLWSEKSNERLSTLLARLDGHVDQTATLKGMLEASMVNLSGVLNQYKNINESVGGIASQMRLAAVSLQQVVSEAKSTQDAMHRTSQLSAKQVEKLEEAHKDQEVVWQNIHQSMERYQQVFGKVEKTSQELLVSISEHLKNFSETTKHHFEGLVIIANEHISEAVNKLNGAVGELDISIQDLGDALGKTRQPPSNQ